METKSLSQAQRRDYSAENAADFARLLLELGRYEPVRSIEAIAAAIANHVNCAASQVPSTPDAPFQHGRRPRQERFARHIAVLTAPFGVPGAKAKADAAYASCLRIARRAIAGAISDPTGGATRFHPIDEAPQWARGLLPSASIGGFLFYRENDVNETSQPALSG